MFKRKVTSRSSAHSLLSSALIAGILFFTAAMARGQESPKVLPFFESAVVSINGSVVQCLGGFSADLSEAQIVSQFGDRSIADIEAGVIIRVSGEPAADPNNASVMKAKTVVIDLKKGLHIEGVIQSVDRTGNTLTILNKQILIDGNTKMLKKNGRPISIAKLKPGKDIALDVENTASGLVARKIVKAVNEDDSARAQLIGFVTAMNGNLIEIAGSFSVDISKSLAESGSVAHSIRVGSKVDVPFDDETALNPTDPLKCGISIGLFANTDGALLGTLQEVDLENRQITVFQKKIAITDRTFVRGPNNETDLSSLKLGPGFRTFVIFSDLSTPTPAAIVVSQSPVN